MNTNEYMTINEHVYVLLLPGREIFSLLICSSVAQVSWFHCMPEAAQFRRHKYTGKDRPWVFLFIENSFFPAYHLT